MRIIKHFPVYVFVWIQTKSETHYSYSTFDVIIFNRWIASWIHKYREKKSKNQLLNFIKNYSHCANTIQLLLQYNFINWSIYMENITIILYCNVIISYFINKQSYVETKRLMKTNGVTSTYRNSFVYNENKIFR